MKTLQELQASKIGRLLMYLVIAFAIAWSANQIIDFGAALHDVIHPH